VVEHPHNGLQIVCEVLNGTNLLSTKEDARILPLVQSHAELRSVCLGVSTIHERFEAWMQGSSGQVSTH